jgi:photosystem II stability/assembly factor-like uncharacterized protein
MPDLPGKVHTFAVAPDNPRLIYAAAGALAESGSIYRSEDAGITWKLVSNDLADVLALAVSSAPATVYAVNGLKGEVFASGDSGVTWARVGETGQTSGFHRRLVSAPGDPKVLFDILDPGGLSRSTDGGRTWTPLSEGLPGDGKGKVYVQALAVDATNPDVLYAGTGGFVGEGHGVYKSVDGGMTWSAANRGMLDSRVFALAIDPAHPQTIYAGDDSGKLFKSADGAQTWVDLTAKLPQQMYHSSVHSIILDAEQAGALYVLCDNTGMLFSNDGGEHWSVLGKPADLDQPHFVGAAIAFTPQPVVVVSVEDAGSWRWAP